MPSASAGTPGRHSDTIGGFDMSIQTALLPVAASGPARARRRPSGLRWLAPALALLTLCFVVPVLMLLLRSFTEPEVGLQHYRELVGSWTYARVLGNTFLVA